MIYRIDYLCMCIYIYVCMYVGGIYRMRALQVGRRRNVVRLVSVSRDVERRGEDLKVKIIE